MDLAFSKEDLAFRDEVRAFIDAYTNLVQQAGGMPSSAAADAPQGVNASLHTFELEPGTIVSIASDRVWSTIHRIS